MSPAKILMMHLVDEVKDMFMDDLTPWERDMVRALVAEELVVIKHSGQIKEVLY